MSKIELINGSCANQTVDVDVMLCAFTASEMASAKKVFG